MVFVRNILRIVDGFNFLFYLVSIIVVSNKKQRIGDKIVKAVVLRSVMIFE